MFETKTQEALLEDLLRLVPAETNISVGSLVYTTLAAMAEKMEIIYADLEEATQNTFADTADRESLIRRAAERGMTPKEATAAVYLAHFNCEVEIGDRFEIEDYTLVVRERATSSDFEYVYKLETEQTGSDVNNLMGEIDYIEGYNEELETAEIYSLLIPAEDEQDTEDFRQEYFANANIAAFAGNVQSYIEAVNEVDGVGAAKVQGVNEGVRIVFVNSTYGIPSEELIEKVQNVIDPSTDVNNWGKEYGLPEMEDYSGMGYGLAPIDHTVLCEAPEPVIIDVTTSLTLKKGYSYENVKTEVEKTIENYLMKIRSDWRNTANPVVRRSHIEAALIGVEGVEDVTDTLVNNKLKVTLNFDQIPLLGTVSNQ